MNVLRQQIFKANFALNTCCDKASTKFVPRWYFQSCTEFFLLINKLVVGTSNHSLSEFLLLINKGLSGDVIAKFLH